MRDCPNSLAHERKKRHQQQQTAKNLQGWCQPKGLRQHAFCRAKKHIEGASLQVVGRHVGSPVPTSASAE